MKSKSNLFRTLIMGLGLGMAVMACEEDPIAPDPTTENPTTASSKSSSKISGIIALKANISGFMANGSIGGSNSSASGRAEARKAMNTQARGDGDYEDDWEWETCADVTETENADGSYTIVYDYGEGCQEVDCDYEITVFGKLTDTFFWTEDETSEDSWSGSSNGSTVFENFGERFAEEEDGEVYNWEYIIDGNSEYTNTFSETFTEDDFAFTSDETYKENLTITEVEDGEQYSFSMTSDVEETYEYGNGEDKLTVTKGDYDFSGEDGESYSARVISPLVMLFDCEGAEDEDEYVFTFVSGVEEITYEGETYSIDYGNGTCDNIVTITNPDGTTETVDLGDYEDEEDDEDEEGEDDEDSDDEDGEDGEDEDGDNGDD
ncbi:MAG: hypothetical protein NXI20_21535 [bacterium]|nr:hypothetical protein [bacterium]